MLFALFIGCPWVGPEVYADRVMDADGDAVRDERFGGRDCADGNPAIGDCDVDGDGHRAAPFGDDCDDTNGAISPS
ncbi:MAG: hypothetical protein KC656_01210, partial [Myxococcales bacterium]|nr:hypothetical protein [Myxococcales bacterium]